MNMEPNYIEHFKNYSKIYQRVKEIIIISENYEPNRNLYIAPLNEFRNSLDHIVKVFAGTEFPEKEIDEATQHLLRAGYDSWEILSINLIKDITDSLNKYDSSAIVTVFPEYYTKVKPKLIIIKNQLIDIRSSKKIPESDFQEYFEKVNELIKIKEIVANAIPVLEEYKKKEKFNFRKKNIVTLSIGVLIGIVVGIIILLIEYHFWR